MSKYKEIYYSSIKNKEDFWKKISDDIFWYEKPTDAEKDMIDMAYEPKKNSRLSCQIIISNELDGLEVTTPLKQT